MSILNQSELHLTRVKVAKETSSQLSLLAKKLEAVSLKDIIWAEEYLFDPNASTGTIMLLKSGEFRSYIQSMDFINNQVYRLVGRLTKEGKEIPELPWMK